MKRSMWLTIVVAAAWPASGCFSFGMGFTVSDPPPAPPAPEEPATPPPSDAPPTEGEQTVCEVGELAQCTGRCEAGDGASCNNLGAMYELGQGVDQDLGRAAELYARACSLGADGGCQNATRLRTPAPPAPRPDPGASSWGL